MSDGLLPSAPWQAAHITALLLPAAIFPAAIKEVDMAKVIPITAVSNIFFIIIPKIPLSLNKTLGMLPLLA